MFTTFILILLLLLPTMSFLPGVQRLLTNALGLTSGDSNGAGSSGSSSNSTASTIEYQPSALDVVVVKAMLTNGLRLPHEIVLSLLDHAEYWPHTTTTLDHSRTVSSGAGRENQFIVSAASQPQGFALTNP